MSAQIDTALVNQYRSNIEIQFQQKGSRLRRAVDEEPQSSEYEYYDRIGPVTAQKVTTRHGDTQYAETPHTRRRVAMEDFDWADLIDSEDKIRMLADPTSSYAVNAVMALGRAVDQSIIDAFKATASTGKAGAGTAVWDTAQTIAVDFDHAGSATPTNLILDKIRHTKYLFDVNESVMDGEELFFVVSASQMESLLRTTEVISADYNTVKALAQGQVNSFMGFTWIRTELLPEVAATNIRSCFAFPRSAMKLGMGKNVTVEVDRLPTKRYSTQVYAKGSWGATRMWEKKIVEILCDEDL